MSPKAKKLLDWLARAEGGRLLESQITGSGLSRALDELLLACLVDMEGHPTVKERNGVPAASVVLKKTDVQS